MNDTSSRDVLGELRPGEGDLVFIDSLTGLYNQRLLSHFLDNRWEELVSLGGSFAFVMIDLDLFKEVNDRYGHLSGDEVLRVTAGILQRTFRQSDMLFRYGGDEFVVLLPGASAAEAEALGERAREAIREHEFFDPEEQAKIDVPVSFSIGVAAYPGDGDSGRAVLSTADDRLYAEKRQHLAARRRRRMIVTGATVVFAAMAIAVSILVFFERQAGRSTQPVVIVEPPPVSETTSESNDREALLQEIAELQRQIAELRAKGGSATTDQSGNDLAALERKVLELTRQLQAQSEAVQPEPAPQPERAAPPATEPAKRPPAPEVETDAPVARRVLISPPRLKNTVIPDYPPFAKERGIEAVIDLEILVDETGKVTDAVVLGKPIGFGFEDAAREAALASEWTPAYRDGVAVPMRTTLQVRFESGR